MAIMTDKALCCINELYGVINKYRPNSDEMSVIIHTIRCAAIEVLKKQEIVFEQDMSGSVYSDNWNPTISL